MDKSNFKGRGDDHKELVFMLLHEVNPRKVVSDVIHASYDAGYEAKSDGITLMPELAFSGFHMKHPAGVGHDWLYYKGCSNPFLPKIINSGRQARLWADNWFRYALIDFGHPWRARIWWLGLRAGGWYGWYKHRKAGHPFTEKYDKETGNLK